MSWHKLKVVCRVALKSIERQGITATEHDPFITIQGPGEKIGAIPIVTDLIARNRVGYGHLTIGQGGNYGGIAKIAAHGVQSSPAATVQFVVICDSRHRGHHRCGCDENGTHDGRENSGRHH